MSILQKTPARYAEPDLEAAAKVDGDSNTYQADRVLDQMLGVVHDFDPENDAEHADIADTLHQAPVTISEMESDMETCKARIADTLRMTLFVACLKVAVAAAIETYGCTRVMTNFGFAFPENLAFGLALAVGIFRLVAYLQDRRRIVMYLALAALAIVSVGMAGARLDAGGATSWNFSAGIVTLLATVGPALFADGIIAALREAYPDIRRKRTLNVQLHREQARYAAAKKRRHDIDAEAKRARELRVRALAVYDATFTRRRAQAEQQTLFPTSLHRV